MKERRLYDILKAIRKYTENGGEEVIFMQTVEQALLKLSHSRFRSSFKLTKKEKEYIDEKGLDVIRSHARDFVRQKLAPDFPENDGTPCAGESAERRQADSYARASHIQSYARNSLLLPRLPANLVQSAEGSCPH